MRKSTVNNYKNCKWEKNDKGEEGLYKLCGPGDYAFYPKKFFTTKKYTCHDLELEGHRSTNFGICLGIIFTIILGGVIQTSIKILKSNDASKQNKEKTDLVIENKENNILEKYKRMFQER